MGVQNSRTRRTDLRFARVVEEDLRVEGDTPCEEVDPASDCRQHVCHICHSDRFIIVIIDLYRSNKFNNTTKMNKSILAIKSLRAMKDPSLSKSNATPPPKKKLGSVVESN